MSGIGIDLVDLRRAARFVRQHRERLDRVLSPSELRLVRRSASPAKTFAYLFASKEAVSKALGIRVEGPGQLRDFTVRMRRGRPVAAAKGSSARFELSSFEAPGSVGVLALAFGGAVR